MRAAVIGQGWPSTRCVIQGQSLGSHVDLGCDDLDKGLRLDRKCGGGESDFGVNFRGTKVFQLEELVLVWCGYFRQFDGRILWFMQSHVVGKQLGVKLTENWLHGRP